MAKLILDSGAIIALAARRHQPLAFLTAAIQQKALVIIPTVVIAETTRGTNRDAAVNRVIKNVDWIAPVSEEVARLAGRLLAMTDRRNMTIDALVAAQAILSAPSVIMTSDLDDLSLLLSDFPRVRLRAT